MPTYDYRCEACGHTFELFQSIKADPATSCPACGKETARRVIGTGGGLIFKGSGFYITDYRSESYKAGAKSDSGGSGSPATPASTAPATPAPAAPSGGSTGSGGASAGSGGGGAASKSSTAAA